MKTVWVSALLEDTVRIAAVAETLRRYGFQSKGHCWLDAPEKMAWRDALDAALEARADLWLVLVDETEWGKPLVRYGLSLMAAGLREARGAQFPIVVLWKSVLPLAAAVPPLMRPVQLFAESVATWPAKMVARVNAVREFECESGAYRLGVLGGEQLGQWFEIGPRVGSWPGVIFGVSGGDATITFQAVGPKGRLPERSTLEFRQEGLLVKGGGRDFAAWSVRNEVGRDFSYFARVKGLPECILFMPWSEDDEAFAEIICLH